MTDNPPMPVLDVSNPRFIVALGLAAREHVSPDVVSRPRSTWGPEHVRWANQRERRCLYCGTPDPIGSEEHVLGVALGNWWWVIPPDVVCHACNHGPLAQLDEALKQHPFIALTRTLTNVPGRTGQLPNVNASNLQMRRTEGGGLEVATNSARHATLDNEQLTAQMRWSNFGPRQRTVTARALMKVALGALWLARGPAETAQARYDHVRDAVLDRAAVPLQTGFGNAKLPNHALTVMVISDQLTTGVHVSVNYFGIELWATSAGYEADVSPEFIASDTRHQYVDGDENSAEHGDGHEPGPESDAPAID